MNALAHNLDSCTVLVIDDDEIIRMVVREGLRAFGCTVVEAGDPEVGIGMAHQTHPDVIILDIMLPRIDGLSLLERMRAEEIASSVIVFSATGTRHAELVDCNCARQPEATCHLRLRASRRNDEAN